MTDTRISIEAHGMTATSLIMSAMSIREKLRRPPNAVPDRPISLRREKNGVTGYEAAARTNARRMEIEKAGKEAAREREKERAMRISFPSGVDIPSSKNSLTPALNLDSPLSVREIQREVAAQWRVNLMDIVSDRRTNIVCEPRQIAMALSKELTRLSFPNIGQKFGGKDHSTIHHACRKYEWLITHLRAVMSPESTLSEWVACARREILNKHQI